MRGIKKALVLCAVVLLSATLLFGCVEEKKLGAEEPEKTGLAVAETPPELPEPVEIAPPPTTQEPVEVEPEAVEEPTGAETTEPQVSCTSPVRMGDTVKIDFVARTKTDMKVVDATIKEECEKAGLRCRPTQEVTLGTGQIANALEAGIVGMCPGEEKEVELPADAFGIHNAALVKQLSRSSPSVAGSKKVGKAIAVSGEGVGIVTELTSNTVTVDLNHPLAGKVVIYEVHLV